MHVVFAHMPLDYLYLSAQAGLSYQFPRSCSYLSFQHLIPILRYPHKVVLDVIQRMRSASILRHDSILAIWLKQFRLKAKDSTGRLDIERFIGKLKHFRRCFSRFDKLARNYLSFLYFASTLIWLRGNVNTT